MKSKSLFKFIYKEILPLAIGFTTMTVLQISYPELIIELNPFQLIVLMIILFMPILIIQKFIEGILFGRKDNLAAKIMKCSLRKQHGLDYCVKCPDSYTCPTELSGMG